MSKPPRQKEDTSKGAARPSSSSGIASRKLAGDGVSVFHVLFRQFVDDDLGCASYLIGDPSRGEAVVVDPAYAIEQYLEAARQEHVRVVRVLETHTHADHVSGHGRFALEHGIPVSVHPDAEPEFAFDPLDDEQLLHVGGVPVLVLHTPGHRPEHCAFVVDDRLVLTGDSLFVGDAARPDLAVDAREGAEGLYRSLQRLTQLPDAYEVYPGHVAGSLCGAAMSPARSTTIAAEKQTNAALVFGELQEFVASSAAVSTPRPPTTARVVELNKGPFLGAPSRAGKLDKIGSATVLDVRPAAAHAVGHVHGAFNVPVSASSFATRAGFILDPGERIVIHATDDDEAERALRGLRSVGFLELAGYVTEAEATERSRTIELSELERLLDDGEVQVLDVREKSERDEGYIPGSLHIPYRLLRETGADGLDTTKPVVTICESGARAGIAASVLAAAGVDARPVLDGGIEDWPGQTVYFRRCGT
jgi:glyoxylase-like metal-dependent hydrolase (beta-lactamase superfamily II)/rhodanese-related sulfurtransferase